jgi:PAS domain S-box-containing protein
MKPTSDLPRTSSEADFGAVFAAAPGQYLVLSPDLTIVDASNSYLAATMTVREQVCGRNLFEVFPDDPDDPSASGEANLRASLDQVRRELTSHTMAVQKYDIRQPDSEGGGFEVRYRSPTNSPVLDDRGELTYIIHRVEDVTGSKGTEAALIENEEKLEASRQQAAEADNLFTLSVDMLAVAGFDGYFKRLNASWTATLGHSVEDLMARPYVEFIHPDDRLATETEAAEVATGNDVISFENRYRHADGSYRTLAWSARPSVEEKLIYAVARDVTAQKEAEESLRMAQGQAEAARLKSQFMRNMSHELRTPMNGVIGMTDLLLSTALTSEQTQYAETIRRSGDAFLAVINDILDFSKIESGRVEIEAVDFDLRMALEEVADIVAGAAQSRNLEVVTVIQSGLPDWVRGDRGRLRQVLLNLAANAVKFTDKGEVVIRAQLDSDSGDAIQARFEVTDTGPGISPETQEWLFSAFTQADASDTRRYGGTGLGLAISSQLVSLMGGQIGVDSRPGEGSIFWFTLPLQRSA